MQNTRPHILDRVDRLPPWKFTTSLYLARWIIVLPIAFLSDLLFPSRSGGHFKGITLFGAVIVAPILETLIECLLPYWAMKKFGFIPNDRRPWAFVIASASLMALLHAGAWPAAILPSLVTGSFLAYVFGHFAPISLRTAFLHTVLFHAAINLVGCALIFLN